MNVLTTFIRYHIYLNPAVKLISSLNNIVVLYKNVIRQEHYNLSIYNKHVY